MILNRSPHINNQGATDFEKNKVKLTFRLKKGADDNSDSGSTILNGRNNSQAIKAHHENKSQNETMLGPQGCQGRQGA